MVRTFFAVFGAAFIAFTAGLAMTPNLVLGAFQDDVVRAWQDAGVDTSSCDGSVPALGIGVRECYAGALKDIARQIDEAEQERNRFESDLE